MRVPVRTGLLRRDSFGKKALEKQNREFETRCTASPEDLLPELSQKSRSRQRRTSLTLSAASSSSEGRSSRSADGDKEGRPSRCRGFVGDLSLTGLGREHSFGDELLLDPARIERPAMALKAPRGFKVRNLVSAKPLPEPRLSPPPAFLFQTRFSNLLRLNQVLARKPDLVPKNRIEILRKINANSKVLAPFQLDATRIVLRRPSTGLRI